MLLADRYGRSNSATELGKACDSNFEYLNTFYLYQVDRLSIDCLNKVFRHSGLKL